MNENPKISVLLTVYNSASYIGSSIESILQQTFRDFELIIIDDCSTDGSWEIVQKYAGEDPRIVAYKNEQNLGGCRNLISGLQHVRGKYIARQDNDDWSYPDRLEKQFAFLESHPEVGIVGGSMEIMDTNGEGVGKRTYHLTDTEIRKKIFRYSPFAHPLVMIRRSVLDKVGPYDPVYAPADDYDLYFRIGKESQFANLPDVLLKYRMVPGSMTFRSTKKMELTTIQVRSRYSKDSRYPFSPIDQIYNWLHYLSIFIIPPRIKIHLFNWLRNER